MPRKRDAARGSAAVILTFLLCMVLAGCDLVVEDAGKARDATRRSAMSTAVADLPEFDVTVSAIDFDPPLKRETLFNYQKSVKLLAAVENRGTMPLTKLLVEARVSNHKGDFSANDRVPIERLSPGETKVVEFESVAPVPMLPRSPSYRVRVTVESQQPAVRMRSASREVIVRVVDGPPPED